MSRQHPAFDLLDEATLLPLAELARACAVDVEWVEQLAAHGVVTPAKQDEPVYSALCITRLRKARRLERDLELNTPALALVMELLDEIERLRAKVVARNPGSSA